MPSDRSVSSYHCHRRDSQSVLVIPQARLKEIGKLDQWLQTAARERDPRAMQAVCATQWSFCLPVLQHNLRRRIKTPLLRVAQVLEDMQRFPASSNSSLVRVMCACLRAFHFFCCICTLLNICLVVLWILVQSPKQHSF